MTDCAIFTSENRKTSHMKWTTHKATQISAKQYLQDQLHKYTKTDPLEINLTQLGKQPVASNNNNNIYNGPHRNNTTHEQSTLHKELAIIEENVK